MADILELNLEDEKQLCTLGAALSSPARIQILRLLYHWMSNVCSIHFNPGTDIWILLF